MNFEQLLYIVEVTKYNSLSIAAQKLHVTQSGISQSITSLEKELGIKILHRSRGHGAVPTAEGRVILKQAYEVLRKFEEIKETAYAFHSKVGGELKISSIPGLTSVLVKALTAIKKDYPHVKIEINEKSGSAVIEDVRQRKTDIGLIAYSPDWNINMEGIAFESIIEGQQKVYVSKHSHLADTGTISSHELVDQTLVTYYGEYMQYFVQDFFEKYQPMNILFTSNNSDGIIQAIIDNLAITFAPDFIMENYLPVINGDITPVYLENHRGVNISLGLVLSEDKHLSILLNKYIQSLISEIKKI